MPGENENKDGVDLKALQETLTGLNTVLGQLPRLIAESTAAGIRSVVESYEADDDKDDKGDEPDPSPSEEDLEGMSRKDLIAYMDKKRESDLKALEDRLTKETTEVKMGTAEEKLKREYAELLEDEPLAEKLLPEMQAIAKENPRLSLRRLYQLAVADNPDRVAEIKAEETKEDNEKKKADNPDHGRLFGGLTPTSTIGDEEPNQRMSKEDAADAAWEQHMKDLPPEVFGNA